MTTRILARRLERLEDSLLPANDALIVLKIILVSSNGEATDSGIEFRVPTAPNAFKKRPQ